MLYEAFMAGVWSSLGSTVGKLSGTHVVVGDSYLIWASMLILMVLVNTWGCRCYLRSLDAANNSVAPTVISSASSYILSGDSYLIWASMLILMVLVNTWGCRCYLRSLDAANNSVAPTVISSASSYILSGLIGVILFNEASSITWWIGTALIVQGLALVARQPKN